MSPTRRVVMFNRVTAEGLFAGPDGNLDWTVPEPEIDKAAAKAIPDFDTFLFGRRTYEQFAQFWPNVGDDAPTAPDPHHALRRSPEIRAMATALNEGTKLVFSRTLKNTTWKNTRIMGELDPKQIDAMKRQPGKNMIIFGSGEIVSKLTEHGLIDEYQLVVTPILLGNGRPLLRGVPKNTKLRLLDAKGYPSGNVLLHYARAT